MKICSVCQAQLDDGVAVCLRCGAVCGTAQPTGEAAPQTSPPPPHPQYQSPYNPYQPPAAPYVDPFDHTSDFAAEDIRENRLFAMLPYLFSLLGVLVAQLGAKDSAYVRFHVRQALRLCILQMLTALLTAMLFWTVLGAIAGGVCLVILLVQSIMGFCQACGGKAKELAIPRSFSFLK